jgi:hypothetical protein
MGVQVALYGLLLESRYGVEPLDGLLWYSSSDDMESTYLKVQDIAGAPPLKQPPRTNPVLIACSL